MPTKEASSNFNCSYTELKEYIKIITAQMNANLTEELENKIVCVEDVKWNSRYYPITYESTVREISAQESELCVVASNSFSIGSGKHVSNKILELIGLVSTLCPNVSRQNAEPKTVSKASSITQPEQLAQHKNDITENINQQNIEENNQAGERLKISLLLTFLFFVFAVWVSFFDNNWGFGKYIFALSGLALLSTFFFGSRIAKLCPNCSSKKFICDSQLSHQETTQKQRHVLNHNTSKWEWVWKVVTISYFLDNYNCNSCGHTWLKKRAEESV